MIIKHGIIRGQLFDHKGLLEINVHIVAGLFFFLSSLILAALLWRKFHHVRQGWFALRAGIVSVGLIGLGEVSEHFFSATGHDFFHYLFLIAAPVGLFFIYAALLELEALYFKTENKTVIPVSWIYGILLLELALATIFGWQSRYPWKEAIEQPFLIIMLLPNLFIAFLIVKKSISLYREQHRLSLFSLSIFSTVLALVPLLAIGNILLSLDILIGRYADKLTLAVPYVITHSVLDVLMAGVGAIMIGSSVMLVMAPDLRVLQERIVQSAKFVALGELAANITYQLDSPLDKIKILSELALKENQTTSQLKKDLEKMLEEATKATDIARNLANFSRTTKPHFQVTSLKGLIDDSLSLMEPRLRHGGIRITKKLQKPLPYLSVDRNQVKQVFVDLLNNAADAVSQGGHIEISAFISEGWVEISFQDNGPGIEDQNLEHIFEPFFTTKKNGRGTGLGLSLAASVIQNHGGQIDAKSEEGKGARILIKLPALAEEFLSSLTDKDLSVIEAR